MNDMGGRFEVWFLSDERISVFVETDLEATPEAAREVHEALVFTAVAAGIIANLPKAVAKPLCTCFADFEGPATREDISTSVRDRVLVLPQPDRDRNGFEGTVRMKEGRLPVARMKSRGFGWFGSDVPVQDYAQAAALALFIHLLAGFSSDGRVMLVEAARTLGNLGLAGAIRVTTHSHAAWTALEAGVEAVGSGK
jgi:hypothetical protein